MVKDFQASIENLRRDAAEAAQIRDLASNKGKSDVYGRLHDRFNLLADEVERAMGAAKTA